MQSIFSTRVEGIFLTPDNTHYSQPSMLVNFVQNILNKPQIWQSGVKNVTTKRRRKKTLFFTCYVLYGILFWFFANIFAWKITHTRTLKSGPNDSTCWTYISYHLRKVQKRPLHHTAHHHQSHNHNREKSMRISDRTPIQYSYQGKKEEKTRFHFVGTNRFFFFLGFSLFKWCSNH